MVIGNTTHRIEAARLTEIEAPPISSAAEHVNNLLAQEIASVEVREISAEDKGSPAEIAPAARETWQEVIAQVAELVREILEEPIGRAVPAAET